MKFFFAPLAALAAVTAVLGQLTINTPTNVVVCQPILLTWQSGTPPYYVSILPGSQPSASALVTFPSTNDTTVTWIANIAAGQSIGLTIRDSTGATASSAPFTINPGSDTSCVGKNPTSSGTGSTSPTTAGATSASGTSSVPLTTPTTPVVTTPRVTSTTGTLSSPSSSSAGSSTTTKSATTSNAASTQAAQLGAAGLIGAAVIALMA